VRFRKPIDPARVLRTLFAESDRENEVVEETRGYAENSQEAARQVGPLASKSFGKQMVVALVAATAIGFVLGVLWKRR
jgi:preprotein translocase subunit SecF